MAGFALGFCFLARSREAPDRTSRTIQAGWVALFVALTFYAARPVVRWDYLFNSMVAADQADDPVAARAWARALIDRTDSLRDTDLSPKDRAAVAELAR